MNLQTGLLVLVLLILVLFLIFRLKLHWLWDLGFFLFFLILGAMVFMNHSGNAMQAHHWNALGVIVLGYATLVVFAGSVCAIRTYTESVPDILKRLDAIQFKLGASRNEIPPVIIASSSPPPAAPAAAAAAVPSTPSSSSSPVP